MNKRIGFSLFRHWIAIVVLLTLDGYQLLRRTFNRGFLRATVVIMALVLLVMVFSSLNALLQITRSVRSLIGDSMVGVEATVSMRSAVRETQLDFLRPRAEDAQKLSNAEVQEFSKNFAKLLVEYRRGVFEVQDEANARLIEHKLADYLAALRPVTDSPVPAPQALKTADEAARQLINTIERAYLYNRSRIHLSATEAGRTAAQALRISKLLWAGLSCFLLAAILAYLAYRWLALPGETED